MNNEARISIVGAGLGGLTAALALIQSGHSVRVFEQAPELREVGAGITISRGAQRIFEVLGIQDAIKARSSFTPHMAFLHYRTAAMLYGKYDFGDGSGDSEEMVGRHMHRADLHAILADAVERAAPGTISLGRQVAALEETNAAVRLLFNDGAIADSDILVGADGIRSVVRETLWGGGEPRFTGQVAWRCMIPIELAKPFMSAGRAAVYLGPDRVFNRYSLRRGALVNCVAIARTDAWRGEGWSTPATHEELLTHYAGWHPDVTGLMARAPTEHLIKWGLFDRDPLPEWGAGRVTLLGDAAHPMLPFLGLGAAMAIEDGIVLAKAIELAGATPSALRRYEAARRARAGEMQEQSRLQGKAAQSVDPDNYDHAATPAANRAFYDFDPQAIVV
jgi:salicylate hydroxylase